MSKKVAMLTTKGDLIPIAQDHDVTEYEELRTYMNLMPHPYDWFEPVCIHIGEHNYIMVVDEEGKLKDSPVNIKATHLYGDFDVIVGDALIFADHRDTEMRAMDKDEWDALEKAVKDVR